MTQPFNWPLAGVALLAACTTVTPTGGAPLGPGAVVSGGTYSSGGGITVAVDLREDRGRTAVCGVWAESRQQSVLTKHVEADLLGTGSIAADGTTLVRGLNFLARVDPAPDYTGLPANCVRSERPWRAGDQDLNPIVHIPRQVVLTEGGDEGSGAHVTFRQTGPGAGDS